MRFFRFKYFGFDGEEYLVHLEYRPGARYDFWVYRQGEEVTNDVSGSVWREIDDECVGIVELGLGLSLVVQESA